MNGNKGSIHALEGGRIEVRTEQEMMTLILNIARQDERIRAVAMNGSRTNKNVPKDIFQDFDIMYLVENIDSFIQDFHWVDVFGERIMMQTPKHMTLLPSEGNERFLPEKTWQHLLSTYANGDYDDVWRALFTTMDVFRTTAKYVAQSLHYEYPDEMDTRVTAYVKHVRRMPPDAAAFYKDMRSIYCHAGKFFRGFVRGDKNEMELPQRDAGAFSQTIVPLRAA